MLCKKIIALKNVFLNLILATDFFFRTEHKTCYFVPKLYMYVENLYIFTSNSCHNFLKNFTIFLKKILETCEFGSQYEFRRLATST